MASYRLVSSLCGAAFVLLHLRLAATLPGLHGWARAAIAWLGLVDGANQLFFGHVENYTLPRLAATWFLISLAPLLLAPPERPSLARARVPAPRGGGVPALAVAGAVAGCAAGCTSRCGV